MGHLCGYMYVCGCVGHVCWGTCVWGHVCVGGIGLAGCWEDGVPLGCRTGQDWEENKVVWNMKDQAGVTIRGTLGQKAHPEGHSKQLPPDAAPEGTIITSPWPSPGTLHPQIHQCLEWWVPEAGQAPGTTSNVADRNGHMCSASCPPPTWAPNMGPQQCASSENHLPSSPPRCERVPNAV